MPTTTPALEVTGLSYALPGHFWQRPRALLSDINLAIPAGEIVGLLGANGAGKTTLIKAVIGLVRADAGQVQIFGRPADRPESRATLGFLPERAYYPEHLSAAELVLQHALLAGLPWRQAQQQRDVVLAQVGLAAQATARLSTYSKGMLQRAGLAQALVATPQLVILDEPTSGLDPLGRRDIRDILLGLRAAGRTVLLSTHILADAELICDRVVILAGGRIVHADTIAQLGERAGSGGVEVRATAVPAALLTTLPEGVRLLSQRDAHCQFEAVSWQAANHLIDRLRGAGAHVREVHNLRGGLEALLLKAA